MKQAFRFSSLPVNTKFEDLAGNKWIKLDEVQAAAPALPTLTKENFPSEQIVWIEKLEEGWVLIKPETDEFYGQVQWRNAAGEMTDKFQTVEQNYNRTAYSFCNAGLGELKIVK